jgi:hypothetical protein
VPEGDATRREREMVASRDSILGADDLRTETVSTEEWGEVRIRTMTGLERDQFDAHLVRAKKSTGVNDPTEVRARLVMLCAVDEKGERLFKEADIPALQGKAGKPLGEVADAIAELNGMGQEEELAKNS